jgi:hypothetical protein
MRRRNLAIVPLLDSDGQQTDHAIEDVEWWHDVSKVLTDVERQVLIAKMVFGEKNNVIAEQLSLPDHQSVSRIWLRAASRLRGMFKDRV